MIAGDATHALLQRAMFPYCDLPLWAMSRWVSVMLPSLFIILPLSMLRNIGALAPTSGLAVAAMTFTSAAITFKLVMAASRGTTSDGDPIMQGVSRWRLSPSMLNAIPIMVFAYQCHVQAVPIYAELTGSPSLLPCNSSAAAPPTLAKKCRGMSRVAAVAFLECTVMYIITGAAGYIQFPGRTQSNILRNYDIHDNLMQTAHILVGAAATLHYPVDLHAARTAYYDLACKYLGRVPVYPPPYPPIAAAAASMFGLTAILACVLTDLGKVFQVIGGLAGSVVIFVLPGAVMIFDPVVLESRAHGNDGPAEADPNVPQESAEADSLLAGQGEGSVLTCAQETLLGCGPEGHAFTRVEASVSSREQQQQQPCHVPSGLRWRWSSTRVWGVIYMSVGSLIMLLTVVLTIFGTPR